MKLLITGAWQCTQEQLNKLEGLGHEIIFMQNEREALPCAYRDVEGVVCNALFLHHPIEEFTSLRYIQLTSAGFDRLPMEKVAACGIAIHNARGVYSIPMAELAVGGVLELYKRAHYFFDNQRKRVWEKHRDIIELYGRTVCIVGCGSVGSECAKRFSAFGCRVIGVDLFPAENGYYERILPLSELDRALGEADVVVLTLPLTSQTRHMMNAARFGAMKRGALLVNIARGAVVCEEALAEALDTHLGGAVLDVFEEEPLAKESPLWQKENVIITPHQSFVGDGNAERLFGVIYANLEKEAECDA